VDTVNANLILLDVVAIAFLVSLFMVVFAAERLGCFIMVGFMVCDPVPGSRGAISHENSLILVKNYVNHHHLDLKSFFFILQWGPVNLSLRH
jgi:hypothetical protein